MCYTALRVSRRTEERQYESSVSLETRRSNLHPVFYGRNMWPSIPPMIGCMDPAEHLHRRRPWNRAFNINAVKDFQPVIGNRVQGLVEALALRSNEVVDLTQWISYFT